MDICWKRAVRLACLWYCFSHVMRKPVYVICEQQRRRSACASAFVVRCLDSIIPLVCIQKISSLYIASVAAQAGLSLPLSQTPKTGFLVTWLILYLLPSLVSVLLSRPNHCGRHLRKINGHKSTYVKVWRCTF